MELVVTPLLRSILKLPRRGGNSTIFSFDKMPLLQLNLFFTKFKCLSLPPPPPNMTCPFWKLWKIWKRKRRLTKIRVQVEFLLKGADLRHFGTAPHKTRTRKKEIDKSRHSVQDNTLHSMLPNSSHPHKLTLTPWLSNSIGCLTLVSCFLSSLHSRSYR